MMKNISLLEAFGEKAAARGSLYSVSAVSSAGFEIPQTALLAAVGVLAVLVIVLLILVIVTMSRMRQLSRKYDLFMRGKDAESMEQSFLKVYDEVEELQEEDQRIREKLNTINSSYSHTYQKTGLVRYDAFKGMGGQFSFALTLLDRDNNGILLNSIHSRETCYLYLKEVMRGRCDVALSAEEERSLEIAVGQR